MKYHHVLAALPQSAIDSILDFIQNPPQVNLYAGLKQKLIERHSLSEERRIEELLSNTELGDKKPSEFYRHMNQLAGSSGTFGEGLIKKLWLRRLPRVVNIALISQSSKPTAELLEISDKIYEAASPGPYVHSVSTPSTSTGAKNWSNSSIGGNERDNSLEKEISELKKMVHNLQNDIRAQHRHDFNRSQSPNHRRSRSKSSNRRNRDIERHPLCWYHFRYGIKARKCDRPCNFEDRATEANTNSQTKN